MFFDSDRPYNELHACKRCSLLSPQQYAYVDKHGDIEQLCANCYTLALEGNESPELASRDRRVAWILAVIGAVLLLVWLTGCATFDPREETISTILINGEIWMEHTDSPNPPAACGPVGSWQGCRVTSLKRIDYVSPVAQWVRKHERTEAAGMRHGAYSQDFTGAMCALIVVGLGEYPTGGRLCITQAGEEIIQPETIAEAK